MKAMLSQSIAGKTDEDVYKKLTNTKHTEEQEEKDYEKIIHFSADERKI